MEVPQSKQLRLQKEIMHKPHNRISKDWTCFKENSTIKSCLSFTIPFAYTVTLLVVFQGYICQWFMQSSDTTPWLQLKNLVVLFGDFCWYTLALIAVLMTTGTVSTTTLNQKTQWPENGVSSLQLLSQWHWEVARSTTIQPHFLL